MKKLHNRRQIDRSRAGRCGPAFDRLELRLALSMTTGAWAPAAGLPGNLSVASVVPAPGSTLTQAPRALGVTFDRPLAPGPASGDFRLDLVAPDGSESPVTSAGASLQEAIDAPGTVDSITTGAPLAPGHYRLYLLGTAGLYGADGSTLAGGGDALIDDFTVAAPAPGPVPGLGGATDLGSPVGTIVSASGSLDLASDPGAVAYYKVELPAGHAWRLGVEVDAARIGSPLVPALSILDAQGDPIATGETGLPDSPTDPYKFLGLGAGTYYIAVSASPGTSAGAPQSGRFRIEAVADPADAATTVLTASLNYADPTEAVPTGLTLQFAGPLDESAMKGGGSGLIRLIDDSGHSWTADALQYNESRSSLSFAFDRALPAGHYRVQLAGQGALVDLAGYAPVAPGLPAGTLAQFTIPRAAVHRDPTDYGPVFPADIASGVSATLKLAPGQEVTYRFVLTAPGSYDFETTYAGGAPRFTAHVGGKGMPLGAGSSGALQRHVVFLQPGVITFDVVGGPGGTTIDWSFLLAGGKGDLLLDNGVGQSSALGLRLIAPAPLDPQSVPASAEGLAAAAGPTGPGAPQTPSASPATPGPASPPGVPGPSAPGGLFIAAGAGLIGHPSTQDEAIAAVGPVAPGGMTALSSSVAGIPQGLGIGSGGRGRAARGLNTSGAVHALLEVPEPEGTAVASAEPAGVGPIADLPPLPDGPTDPASAGMTEVAQGPGLIDRASSFLAGLLPTRRRASARPDAAALDDAALADLGRDPRGDGEEAVESADLTNPLGLGVIVVVVAHSHKRLGRWLGRGKARIVARRGEPTPAGPRRPTA